MNYIDFRMHGATTKIINAQKTKLCTNYKNTKLKLLRTNAAIWFHKTSSLMMVVDRNMWERYLCVF